MSELASALVCAGCGWQAPPPPSPHPFRCARAQRGNDIDHVMRRVLDPARVTFPHGREANPFLRYRSLLHSYQLATSAGLSDADYVALVQRFDRDVLRVDGQGFVVTPFTAYDRLGARLGLAPGRLWVKDETGNVSGSHKARHLAGVMLHLQVRQEADSRRQESGDGRQEPVLAIASCGNAALAAAVVARSARRALEVFVPAWADASVVARLRALGAALTTCPREPGMAGDPCYRRFHEAVERGSIPFCCQGPDNGLTIEGGSTLAWEMIDALGDRPLDRLFVQVGGGALASACAGGFADAVRLGRLARLPRLHAVQTRGGFPLKRAYDRVLTRIVRRLSPKATPGVTPGPKSGPTYKEELSAGVTPGPESGPTYEKEYVDPSFSSGESTSRPHVGPDFSPGDDVDSSDYPALADLILAHADSPIVREELRYAATHRTEFMWPWETEPKSVATGILDDETYDWLAVVEGMLQSGGYPVVVDEDTLKSANALGRDTTGIDVDHTGTAGLAGLMQALADDGLIREETVAVIFSGVRRE